VTIEDVVWPVMLPVAIGAAIFALVALFWYVARRYPNAPKRVPTGVRIDGRPRRLGSRRWLWLAPGALLVVMTILGVTVVRHPPTEDTRTTIALAFIIVAELAWFVAWTTDRQIELARGMTFRIPPSRTLRVLLPILATLAITLALAIHPAS
jgi:hypothetical protein